jgi:hypothetical protein
MKENYAKTKTTYQKTQSTKDENYRILEDAGLASDNKRANSKNK